MAFIILISFTGTPQRSNTKCLENIFHYLQVVLKCFLLSFPRWMHFGLLQGICLAEFQQPRAAVAFWDTFTGHVWGVLAGKINTSWMGEGQFVMLRPLISAELNVLILFPNVRLQVLFEVLVKLFVVLIISLLVIRASSVKRWMFESLSKDCKEAKRLKIFRL